VKTPPSLRGAIAGLGFGCLGSLLGLSLSIDLASQVMNELQLQREGIITEGVILNRHKEKSGEEGETYRVEYKLGPLLKHKASPALHRNQAFVDGDTYSLSRPRSKVLIRYLPAAPRNQSARWATTPHWLSRLAVFLWFSFCSIFRHRGDIAAELT